MYSLAVESTANLVVAVAEHIRHIERERRETAFVLADLLAVEINASEVVGCTEA